MDRWWEDYRLAEGGLQVESFDFRSFGTGELWPCQIFGTGELWSCQIFGTEAGFVKIYIPGGRKKQLGVLNIWAGSGASRYRSLLITNLRPWKNRIIQDMMKKLGFRNICRDFRVFTGTRILTINASVPKNVWQAMNKRVNLWDRQVGRDEN